VLPDARPTLGGGDKQALSGFIAAIAHQQFQQQLMPTPPPAQQQQQDQRQQAPQQQHPVVQRQRHSFSGSISSLGAEAYEVPGALPGSGPGLPPRPPSVGCFGPGGVCQPNGSVIGGGRGAAGSYERPAGGPLAHLNRGGGPPDLIPAANGGLHAVRARGGFAGGDWPLPGQQQPAAGLPGPASTPLDARCSEAGCKAGPATQAGAQLVRAASAPTSGGGGGSQDAMEALYVTTARHSHSGGAAAGAAAPPPLPTLPGALLPGAIGPPFGLLPHELGPLHGQAPPQYARPSQQQQQQQHFQSGPDGRRQDQAASAPLDASAKRSGAPPPAMAALPAGGQAPEGAGGREGFLGLDRAASGTLSGNLPLLPLLQEIWKR
jgi:hypothetical protein